MKDSVSRQQSSYNKGLVLGFTMAEIMVLVIFSLLLVLSFLLFEKEEKIKQLTLAFEAKTAEALNLEQRLSLVLDLYSKNENEFEDLFRELVLAKEKEDNIKVLRKTIVSLSDKTSNLKKTISILQKHNLPYMDLEELDNALEKGKKSINIIKRMREQTKLISRK